MKVNNNIMLKKICFKTRIEFIIYDLDAFLNNFF